MPEFIERIDKRWTLFLDRDGVINKRIVGGYVTEPSAFHFLPGVLQSLNTFSKIFGKIIVVTNQQGIGKGLMTVEHLNRVHHFMLKQIREKGGRVDAIYFCPDLSDKPDNCRKPGVKMAMQAKKDFSDIEFSKSIMVGDSLTDIEFGKNAGMFTVYIGDSKNSRANLTVVSLNELAERIDKSHQS